MVSDEPGLASPTPFLLEDNMSVWTILQLHRPSGKYETSTLFGSPDSDDAWSKAEELGGYDCTVVAIWKGNFAKEVCTERPKNK